MDNQLYPRLKRIRDRMHAVGSAPPESVEGYRALFEIVYAELDLIMAELHKEYMAEIDDKLEDGRRKLISQGL